MPVPTWISELLALVDAAEWDEFAARLHPEGVFRYGSQPEIRGRDAIRHAAEAAVATFERTEHELTEAWEGPGSAVLQGWVTYTLPGGQGVRLPFVNLFRFRDGLVGEYLIHIDPSPLLPPRL